MVLWGTFPHRGLRCGRAAAGWGQDLSFRKMFSLLYLMTFLLQYSTFSGDHKMLVNSHPHLKGSELAFEAPTQ